MFDNSNNHFSHLQNEVGRLKKQQEVTRDSRSAIWDRVHYLEEILARNLLTMHSLLNVLVANGTVSEVDLKAAADEIDQRDGSKDDMIDLDSLLPSESLERMSRSPLDILRRFKDTPPPPTPKEFLKSLEEKE